MSRVAYRKDWENSGDINKIVSELNAGTELNSDGGITFTVDDHDDLFFLLADGIVYPKAITRDDVSEISYRAFIDLRKRGAVEKAKLLSEVSRRIASLEAAPKRKYTMWTKCRLRNMSQIKSVKFKIESVSIRTEYKLPDWLKLKEHFVSGVGRINPNVLPFYGHIIFSVDARNENEASKKIFDAADLFLSAANTSKRSIEFWVQRTPSAKMWLGPNQFFFENRRYIGNEKVWYNESYNEKTWDRFPMNAQEFVSQAPLIRKILKSLEIHPLGMQIQSALKMINEGMISDDLSFRLMRFWSAAETLYTLEGERTPIAKLISRLTFASRENEWLDKLKLERCYNIRNMYVHRGSKDSDDSSLVRHMRELLLHQIYYFLWNGDDIITHSDLILMVDLPGSEQALERRSLAIARRLNIGRHGRHRV